MEKNLRYIIIIIDLILILILISTARNPETFGGYIYYRRLEKKPPKINLFLAASELAAENKKKPAKINIIFGGCKEATENKSLIIGGLY